METRMTDMKQFGMIVGAGITISVTVLGIVACVRTIVRVVGDCVCTLANSKVME